MKNRYENGQPKEELIIIKSDKGDSIVVEYYENGKSKCETTFKNYKKIKTYYKNGQLEEEATYYNNKKHGVAKCYKEDGELWAYITYENGTITEINEEVE